MFENRKGIAPLLVLVGIAVLSLVGIAIAKSDIKLTNSSAAPIYVDKTVEITPSDDSYVVRTTPRNNYGGRAQLYSGGFGQSYFYLKFDTNSLVGKDLTDVKLSFNVEDTSSGSQTLSFVADNSWEEKTINWNNKPASVRTITSFDVKNKGNLDINLTPLIGNAKLVYQAVSVSVNSSSRDLAIFTSKEGSKPPKLVVTYKELSASTPTGTPVQTASPTGSDNPRPTGTIDPHTGTTSAGSGSTNSSDILAGKGPTAESFGLWDPSNPLYQAAGPQKYPTCPKSLHDSYYVIASDGKKYPTWHPIVVTDPSTGQKCSFGHEHGRDPSKSVIWAQVQDYFYYDANHNGKMDPEEQKVAGLPFGFPNEQLMEQSKANGTTTMRHEDHVGHKIEYINGEADAGSELGSGTTGGVNIPVKTTSGSAKWVASGAKCYYLAAMHQGVYSPDAFGNNVHAVMFFSNCTGPNSSYDMKSSVTELVPFGAPGEFTNGCDPEGDRSTPVVIGKTDVNKNYPGSRGSSFRLIIQRACLAKHFLVPQGQYSMNSYEAWAGELTVKSPTKTLLRGANITLDVEDSIRYYDASKPNGVGYLMDLCYETTSDGRKARGGECDIATNYGSIKGITWNSTQSTFKDLHRGLYFGGPVLNNQGGSEVWYTDAFGNNAQTTPFVGSVRQVFSSKNVNYSDFGVIDPRVNDRVHDNGEGTVHAPN